MFKDTPENCELDALLASLRSPAILLHRPYPPIGLPNVQSHLGGLPCLPEDVEWPMGISPDGEEVPLHFLAQIDCSELPDIGARLPKSGMLFFFGRDDEEQIWGYGSDLAADGRVIFAPEVALDQPVRLPPVGLRPIADDQGEYDFREPWVLPGEDGPSLHTAWPLVALRLETWPDSSAVVHPFGVAYQQRVDALRTGALLTATETPTCSNMKPSWEDRFPYKRQFELPFNGSELPPVGIFVERTARRVLRKLDKFTKDKTSSTVDAAGVKATQNHPYQRLIYSFAEQIIRLIWPHSNKAKSGAVVSVATIVDEAWEWIKFGESTLKSKLSTEDMDAFCKWLAKLWLVRRDDPNRSEVSAEAYSAWLKSPLMRLRMDMGRLLTLAARDTIRLAATTPSVAEALEMHFFDTMENEFIEIYQYTSKDEKTGISRWSFQPRFHHMLGHSSSSQDATPIDSKTVCLLHLATDDGTGLSFGDVGEAVFWINEEDLIARRFDKAWVKLEGH